MKRSYWLAIGGAVLFGIAVVAAYRIYRKMDKDSDWPMFMGS